MAFYTNHRNFSQLHEPPKLTNTDFCKGKKQTINLNKTNELRDGRFLQDYTVNVLKKDANETCVICLK